MWSRAQCDRHGAAPGNLTEVGCGSQRGVVPSATNLGLHGPRNLNGAWAQNPMWRWAVEADGSMKPM